VLQGEGQIISVPGEAGMGKSHLIEAFSEKIEDETYEVWHRHCHSAVNT